MTPVPRPPPVSDVTRILSQIDQGDPRAAEKLLPLVYDELRRLAAARLAQEKPGQTLQATALVHEAYIRLVGGSEKSEVSSQQSDEQPPASDVRSLTSGRWNSRGHFFGAAAEAMRRILLNQARDKATAKRGVDWSRVTLDAIAVPGGLDPAGMIAFQEAFDRLAELDGQAGEVAKLRIFAGLTVPEIAEALNLGRRTVDRHWAFARAWLRTQFAAE